MNEIIRLLKSHRSIRKFTNQPIDEELLLEMIRAGQCAATSSFLQGTTVIRVKNPKHRKKIAVLAGNQQYVETAAEFLMFCADLKRSGDCCEMHGKTVAEGFTEHFIIATVDAALMAQNVVIAAESEGLGICYIGGIRNNPAEICKLLNIPKNVYPVFGLCIGYPAQNPETKPRLPVSVVLKNEVYEDMDDLNIIAMYDEHVREYYRTRTGGKKELCWSEQMAELLGKESRPHMRAFLREQGFEMK
ncbi:MAG: oxygen-insensitive NADPH nitroreductase [Desulfobacterales bacterium]|nr:oxygen-insensitive NADPH nitroreductase [Desulfobacterales bacterium]